MKTKIENEKYKFWLISVYGCKVLKNLNQWRQTWLRNLWKYNKVAGHGGRLKSLKPRAFCHVSKYNNIAGNGGKFKSLKPPVIRQCFKIQQDKGQQGKFKSLKPPLNLQCLKIQQDSRPNHWSHKCFRHESKYNKIAGNGGNFAKIEGTSQFALFQIQQDCRQRGKIEATWYFSIFEIQQESRPRNKRNKSLKPLVILPCFKIQQLGGPQTTKRGLSLWVKRQGLSWYTKTITARFCTRRLQLTDMFSTRLCWWKHGFPQCFGS